MSKREIPNVDLIELWHSYGGSLAGPDRGAWRKAVCPLHEDGTASAVVNEDEGVWRCFACSVGGDAIQLIMEKTGAGFLDALGIAEEFAGRGNAPVREQRSGSSLLPRGKGHHAGGGGFVPPWKRV